MIEQHRFLNFETSEPFPFDPHSPQKYVVYYPSKVSFAATGIFRVTELPGLEGCHPFLDVPTEIAKKIFEVLKAKITDLSNQAADLGNDPWISLALDPRSVVVRAGEPFADVEANRQVFIVYHPVRPDLPPDFIDWMLEHPEWPGTIIDDNHLIRTWKPSKRKRRNDG